MAMPKLVDDVQNVRQMGAPQPGCRVQCRLESAAVSHISPIVPWSWIDDDGVGVWRYASRLGVDVPPGHRVHLGEGRTPVRRIPLDGGTLTVLREDLEPNGSHKDRSLVVQVSAWAARGARTLVLSSSGNAAIAAAAACRVARVRLIALVSPLTPPTKIAVIARWGAAVVRSPRAPALCRELALALGAPDIRPSVDDLALAGYRTISFELAERAVACDAVFVYTTSGSTLCGMAQGQQALREAGVSGPLPSLHAAQAGAIARVAQAFGHHPPDRTPERSIVGDLGAKHSRRHGDTVRAVRASGGAGWHASDEAIFAAREWLLDRGINAGLESACSVACALAAARAGAVNSPLVVLSGHYGHEAAEPTPSNVIDADTADEVVAALQGMERP